MAPARKKSPARKKTPARKKARTRKKRRSLLSMKTLAAFVLIVAVAAFVYVRAGGTPENLKRILTLLQREAPEPDRFWEADVFFGDPDSDFLIIERRMLPWEADPLQRADQLLDELLRGPAGTAIRTTPDATVLRSVSIAPGGIARADFSSALAAAHPGGSSSEMLTVFSIVNTLALNIDDIQQVQILIEGRPVDTIAGHLDCRQPFTPNTAIIK